MKRLATLAVALSALAAVTTEVQAAGAERIVVLGAPNDFAASAATLGFTKIEAFAFEAVNIDGYRILVPADEGINAIKTLRERFPAATIDTEATDDFEIAH